MSRSRIIQVFGLVVVLSLGLLWLLPGDDMSSEELDETMSSLSSSVDSTDMLGISDQAEALAERLSLSDEFAEELVDIHNMIISEDIDYILVYNPGGFGGGLMEEDPEWHDRDGGFLWGVKQELGEMGGINTEVVEHKRAQYTTVKFIEAVENLLEGYSEIAPELAAKVAFLAKYNPDIKVVITGRSTGAVFAGKVMELLENYSQVYSIQAGRPFWYNPACDDERMLVIGETDDPLSKGGVWSMIWDNIGRMPSSSSPEDGGIQVLNWYLRAPGHAFTWELVEEGDRTEIVEFLRSTSAS